MAIAKENDLVSATCKVKILDQEFLCYALFLRNVFCIWMRKTFRTLLFLCKLSDQQRDNISGLAARYKIFGVNADKEIIRFYMFCSSKYKIYVAVAFGGNAAEIALRLVL